MLILSRRVGETLFIGDDVTITIADLKGGQVRLAVHAPKHVAVDRSEVRARKLADRTGTGTEGAEASA